MRCNNCSVIIIAKFRNLGSQSKIDWDNSFVQMLRCFIRFAINPLHLNCSKLRLLLLNYVRFDARCFQEIDRS
jgi:hypothetical protein